MQTDQGTIVVVEDDPNIADLVDIYLRREGFRVIQAADGESGLAAIDREKPRLAILDVGLPGMIDGLEVCRRIRARPAPEAPGRARLALEASGGARLTPEASGRTKTPLPILMLTARDGEIDRILGLELGADDYVTKPFSPRELVARVRAILRRTDAPRDAPEVLLAGSVEVDVARREARVAGQVVALAAREFDLLQYLAANAGLALTRQQLLDGVWGAGWFGDERTVDVHVRQLRKKLGPSLALATVWGVGYRLG